MSRCQVCGNDYDASFDVVAANGQRFTFDCFECAIYKLAPACAQCGCRVIGHGVDGPAATYCCAHCAREAGITAAADSAMR